MPDANWEPFRQYLKELLQEPSVKRLIEQRTDIAPRTLARWISGQTEVPDPRRLTSLLQALPHYHDPLLTVIARAMPEFTAPLVDNRKNLLEDLPLDFWIRLLETNAKTPRNLHFTTMVTQMFLQLQSTIDPEHIGIQLTVSQCVPPLSQGHPVRSLREIMKMKTHQSLFSVSGDYLFLGAESLSGYSVALCQASVVQNIHEERRLPVRRAPDELSAAAYPIQRGGAVAGCFLVSSPQIDFFSQRLQYLLQIYAYLLSLAFETDQFYAPEQIRLRPMPAEHVQRPYIAQFQDRVMALLQRETMLSQPQAEIAVWQQLEEALLAIPSGSFQEGDSQHAGTY